MQIKIDTAQVSALATQIEGINGQLTNSASEMKNAMRGLCETWSGEAAGKALELYDVISTNYIDNQKNVVSGYTLFLREMVSTGYEETETVNVRLSDLFK